MIYKNHVIQNNGVIIHENDGAQTRFEVWRDNIVRVSRTYSAEFTESDSLCVNSTEKIACINGKAEKTAFKFTENEGVLRLVLAGLTIVIPKEDMRIRYLAPDGRLLVSQPRHGMNLLPKKISVPVWESDLESDICGKMKQTADSTVNGYELHLRFDFSNDEYIYGLGSNETGVLDRRSAAQYIYPHLYKLPVPILVSSKGYGILVDTASYSKFARDYFGQTFYTEAVNMCDFYFIAGGGLDGVVKGYRDLSGRVPLMPKWFFGYIQSKEHYHTQKELLDTLREQRRRNVPLDIIVQDFKYWTPIPSSGKNWDLERYPDPSGMCDEIHERGARLLLSVWPKACDGCKSQRELWEKNQMLGDGECYNAFDDAASDTYWNQLDINLMSQGVDAWWTDSSEPYDYAEWMQFLEEDDMKNLLMKPYRKFMDNRKIAVYSLLHSRMIYEHQRKAHPEKRVVNLTRSSYTGQQRYSSVVWSGDITGSWTDLRDQVLEGLQYSVSGQPYWTLDIGGFYCAGGSGKHQMRAEYTSSDQLGWHELYTRWLQYACFLPMFRSHGTDWPREIWNFGREGGMFYDTIKKFIELRYRLIPYIYSTAWRVTADNYSFIRLLAFDFPEDVKACGTSDEFMFGASLLVCPVTEPLYYGTDNKPLNKARIRRVYLPQGCGWYDFYTGDRYEGGSTYCVPSPIDIIPLYIREGGIIPMTEVMQYTDERPDALYTIVIAPGRNGCFTVYEDDGNTYKYENGGYSVYNLCWNDASSKLTVTGRIGEFIGMVKERDINISVIGMGERTVRYTGKETSVTF